ncbi:MAG: phenylacetate--CoA ligase PaaK [Reyranellaceae bacterium]
MSETGWSDPDLRLSRDALEALQLKRLQWSVRHAWDNVAHYRNKCRAAQVHPDDLKTLADLARFPFVEKDDLRQTYPYGMFAVPRDRIRRLHASSGTTGRPTVVGYTQGDLDNWAHLVARSIFVSGGRPGDIVHVAYGYGLFTGGLGAHYGAELLGCAVVPMSGGQTEKQVQLIREFGANVVMVTPSYMLAIADEFERQGVDPRSTSLRVGIHGAEPWTDQMRQEIERRMGIDAVDIYGLSEVMGPGVACEFVETKDGAAVWEDHFLPEIVDPATGRPVRDGEVGELVFTTLTKQALPMIRYRTRDLTRLLPGTASAMRRMQRVTGRSDDMMIVRGVNVFPSQIEGLILRQQRLSPHYVIELSRDGRLDAIKVLVEIRPGMNDDTAATRAQTAEALLQSIKVNIGVTATIEIVDVGRIERSIGKAKRVIDLRQSN